MPPSETILEQQRRLLTSIERIEGLARKGQLRECRRFIEDFESDLGSAIEAPILRHLQTRLALLHNRVGRLAATATEASAAPDPKIDAEYDPLVDYRDTLGKAVPAPDLNELAVFVPDTTQIWWRCSHDPQHRLWKATKAQTARGRPCPSCMAEAGLSPNAWHPTDTRQGESWLDAHNHAMLWNMGGC